MKSMNLFAPIAKIDESKHEVWGVATAEVVDKEGAFQRAVEEGADPPAEAIARFRQQLTEPETVNVPSVNVVAAGV